MQWLELKTLPTRRPWARCYGLDPKLFQQVEMDLVVASYHEFLIDLLKVTGRPTQSMLKAAASSVFAASPETADAFAGRMCKSISYCRQKEKSAKSGKKLHPAVRQVILALRGKAGANEESPASARASSPVEVPATSSPQELLLLARRRAGLLPGLGGQFFWSLA